MLRFHRLHRHHKIAILVASFSIFSVSTLVTILSFSGESAFGQVRLQLSIRPLPECQNHIDDDSDGLIDYPQDVGCSSPSDNTESSFSTLTGLCYPLTSTATVGQTVTWVASADNGFPPYTYNWSGTEGISGALSLLQKVYTSTGTKTATVVITSEGISSMPIPCSSSVLITQPASSGGGGGGGSSSSTGTIMIKKTDDTPPSASILESAPPEKQDTVSTTDHPACSLSDHPTFQEAKDYLVCDNVITQRDTEEEYEYVRYVYRKELLGIATKIHLKHPDAQEKIRLSRLSSGTSDTATADTSSYPYHFLDVGVPGQPEWVSQTVEMGVVFGLISNQNTYFRPDDFSTRGEAFAMLMKSVCMDPDQSIQKDWEQRVYEVALRNGITSRSWRDFRPGDPILRQEIFLITARLDRWKDEMGGCDRYAIKSKKISTIIQENNSQNACFLPENPTTKEAEKYLVCDHLLTPSTEEQSNAHIQRIKMLGLALEMLFKHRIIRDIIEPSTFQLFFMDIGIPGQESWIREMVIKGVQHGLISNQKISFRPTDYATRGEVLSLLMKSVCMDTSDSIQSTWEERIYEVALRNGLTQKAWNDFDVGGLIDRGELLIMVAKLDQWKDNTGGCDTYTNLLPKYTEMPLLESAPVPEKQILYDTTSNTQKPGTFALLHEDEAKKIYAYIIKNGGIPDGVRLQYIRVFGGNKSTASRIKIHDISDTEFAEDRWLLGGEIVYVTINK